MAQATAPTAPLSIVPAHHSKRIGRIIAGSLNGPALRPGAALSAFRPPSFSSAIRMRL